MSLHHVRLPNKQPLFFFERFQDEAFVFLERIHCEPRHAVILAEFVSQGVHVPFHRAAEHEQGVETPAGPLRQRRVTDSAHR